MSEGTGDQQRRIETEDINVPPPPRRSGMGRGMKIALGSCAAVGLLGILLVSGCFALLATSGGGADDETAEEEAPTVAIGEIVEVGDVAWRVTEARQASELSAEFADTVQGSFVIVNFDFLNNSSEAVTLDNNSLALIDSEGRESQTEADYMRYAPKGRDIFLERVNPGVTQQGQAIFEVAPGASGFTLQAGDTKPITDVNGYVDLGF